MSPTLASVPWRAVIHLSCAGLVLLLVLATWPRAPMGLLLLALASLSAAAGLVLDEPAAAAVEATPRDLRARTTVRLAAVAVPLTAGALGLGMVRIRADETPFGGLLGELAGCLLVAVTAAALGRRGMDSPGEPVGAVVASVIVLVGLLGPTRRWFDVFTPAPDNRWAATATFWVAVSVVCILLCVWATRDPW